MAEIAYADSEPDGCSSSRISCRIRQWYGYGTFDIIIGPLSLSRTSQFAVSPCRVRIEVVAACQLMFVIRPLVRYTPTQSPTSAPSSSEPTLVPTAVPTTSEPTPAPTWGPTTSEPTPTPTSAPATTEPTTSPAPTAAPITAPMTPAPTSPGERQAPPGLDQGRALLARPTDPCSVCAQFFLPCHRLSHRLTQMPDRNHPSADPWP